MSDDWDNDEFEVPNFNNEPDNTGAVMWEDEEEEVPEYVPATPTPAQVEAAAKKREQEAIAAANKVKFASMANETPEQRKLREQKEAEREDTELAADMFGTGIAKGVSKMSLGGSVGGEPVTLKNIR